MEDFKAFRLGSFSDEYTLPRCAEEEECEDYIKRLAKHLSKVFNVVISVQIGEVED
jgi:hypothetical protein